MNVYAVPPLLAVIAYIPLLSTLSFHRPWNKEHRLLLLYLVPAMLWSFVDFFFRINFLPEYESLLGKIVLVFASWMAIQFIFILRYFSKRKFFILYFSYILLVVLVVLEWQGYIPESVEVTASGLHAQYGLWFFLFAILLLLIACPDLYSLGSRFINTKSLVERNQISYLLVGVAIMVVFGISSFIPGAGSFPMAHIGNIAMASILSFIFLKHKLVDIRFITRRVFVWLGLIAVGVLIYFLIFLLVHSFTGVDIDTTTLALAIMAAIVVGSGVYLLYGFFSRRMDRLFYRARYDYLEKLRIFLRYRLNRVLSLSELSEGLLPLLAGTLHCKRIDLFLPDSSDGDFIVRFSEPGNREVSKARISKDNPLIEWLQRENSYLLRENLDVFPELYGRWGEERDMLKAQAIELLFPLISHGDSIAIMALGKKESGRYTLEDVNLVEAVTSKVAACLEREYLQEQFRRQEKEHLQKELTKREQELALINRLAAVIASSLNMREVYDTFIAELKDVVSVDWATIALIEGDEIRLEVISTEIGSAWQAGEKIRLKGTGTEWVANHKEALVEPDLTKSRRFSTGEGHIKQGIRSVAYLPLIVKNKAIGSLIIASREPNAYLPAQVLLLERLAFQIAMPIENARLYAKAEQRARIDEVTGLFNRRYFNECIKLEIERHMQYSGMLSLILLDLDDFKAYNDVQGHTAGDKILELIGRLVNGGLRNTDLAFRYGGDEFAIILPQSTANDVLAVAERVRRRIANEMSKKNIKLSASLGLACWPVDGYTPAKMVNAADRALYQAKQSGGNRTCIVSRMSPPTGKEDGVPVRNKHKL